ncbi:unnamed protein product [Effrenium voratum]|nr:unnamed protein product [Effrenium voratum]CAJ1428358.1 unnamed protein product [Effrenium voratum]
MAWRRVPGWPLHRRLESGARRWASKGKDDGTPFRGKYSVEGVLLPNADQAAEDAPGIDERLGNRLRPKASSQRLEQAASTEGMYAKLPTDRSTDINKEYQVHESQDHLEAFQKVFRRLRRTGRGESDQDVSNSILKAMEYARKKKEDK